MDNKIEAYLNKHCAFWLLKYLKTSKKFNENLTVVPELFESLQIKKCYQYLFNYIIDFLEQENIIKRINKFSFVLQTSPNKELNSDYSEYDSTVATIEKVINSYPDLLSGDSSPLTTLFPQGDVMFLQENIRPIIDTPDTLKAKAYILNVLKTAISDSKNSSLNILEAGGGTGGLTWSLASVLNSNIDYCFTDISRFFLLRAKTKANELGLGSNMSFSTLNLNLPPSSQGYAEKKYHYILAYNVLHVVDSIHQTIEYLHAQLEEGGKLLLVENTYSTAASNLIWGILPNWWKENDYCSYLSGSPLLSLENWKNALHNTAFKAISFIPNKQQQDAVVIELSK